MAEITTIYQFLAVFEDTLRSAPLEKRKALAKTLNDYERFFPDGIKWASGPSAPVMLYHLMAAIVTVCDGERKSPDHLKWDLN